MASEIIFEFFFANLSFQLPWQPIKFNSLDKIYKFRRGLLKEHFFCQNICSEIAINLKFHFSHCKSMEVAIATKVHEQGQ